VVVVLDRAGKAGPAAPRSAVEVGPEPETVLATVVVVEVLVVVVELLVVVVELLVVVDEGAVVVLEVDDEVVEATEVVVEEVGTVVVVVGSFTGTELPMPLVGGVVLATVVVGAAVVGVEVVGCAVVVLGAAAVVGVTVVTVVGGCVDGVVRDGVVCDEAAVVAGCATVLGEDVATLFVEGGAVVLGLPGAEGRTPEVASRLATRVLGGGAVRVVGAAAASMWLTLASRAFTVWRKLAISACSSLRLVVLAGGRGAAEPACWRIT